MKFEIIILPLILTVTVFVGHSLPINSQIIEPKIVETNNSLLWWFIAFMYYYVLMLIVIYIYYYIR